MKLNCKPKGEGAVSRITNDQREAIVRKAVAERDALLASANDCQTCEHRDLPGTMGPCKTCTRLWGPENGGVSDGWKLIVLSVAPPTPYRCIKPHCPLECDGCNHAVPGDDEALVLIADMLDGFAVDGFGAPCEDGDSKLVDRARAFLRKGNRHA
jgi:hypothetical protein